jgi:hypothetical protein
MNQHSKSVFIVSMIVPILLFTAFGLATISDGHFEIAETTTLETVTWNATRTTDMFQRFDKFLTPNYVNDEISASYLLIVSGYYGDTELLGCPRMGVPVEIRASLTSSSGFIYDVNISYHQADIVRWNPPPNFTATLALAFPQEGLSLTTVCEGPDAFMYLLGQNHSRSVNFAAAPEWRFTSNSPVHSLRVDYSITYFNGTVYKRLVQPFQLDLFQE